MYLFICLTLFDTQIGNHAPQKKNNEQEKSVGFLWQICQACPKKSKGRGCEPSPLNVNFRMRQESGGCSGCIQGFHSGKFGISGEGRVEQGSQAGWILLSKLTQLELFRKNDVSRKESFRACLGQSTQGFLSQGNGCPVQSESTSQVAGLNV